MNYMELFKALSDSAILFIGSAAIIAFGTLVFGGLMWLYLWAGKWIMVYIRKAYADALEVAGAEVKNGKRVKA